MRIAHLTHTLSRLAGGMGRSVPGLARAQMQAGHEVAIFVAPDPYTHADGWPADFDVRVSKRTYLGPAAFAPDLAGNIRSFRPDVIHTHWLWTLASPTAQRAAEALHVPHVIAPRGTLDTWALRHSGHKKVLARILFQDRVLKRCDCIHALTPEELAGVRAIGINTPGVVIPNGVEMVPVDRQAARAELDALYPEVRGKRIAMFLSRVDPKKGLDLLLPAWAQLRATAPDWHLLICGPADESYEQQVKGLANDLDITNAVTFAGRVPGELVPHRLAAAELFVLPSYSEGFSMAVLEAMAAGTAVAVSHPCNFRAVEEHGAGVVFTPDLASTRATLDHLLHLDTSDLEHMGRNGQSLVATQYTWSVIARRMVEIYDALRSPAPALELRDAVL